MPERGRPPYEGHIDTLPKCFHIFDRENELNQSVRHYGELTP